MATEAQIKANRKNAKKAGRKTGSKSNHTLESEAIRTLYIDLAKEHGLPIAKALMKKAMKGDVMAIKEFNDRAYGKAHQSVGLIGKLTISDVFNALSNGKAITE